MGDFGVTFTDTSTFTLEVAYTSNDTDYSDTSSWTNGGGVVILSAPEARHPTRK